MIVSTKPRIRTRLSFSLVLLASVLFLSLLSFGSALRSEDADDETCLACHDGYEAHLEKTSHALASTMPSAEVVVACASCHSGGAEHAEDPTVDNIGNPAALAPAEVENVCGSCHQPHTETGVLGFDPHNGLDLSCVECHSVHSKLTTQIVEEAGGLCGKCHVSAVNQFRKRSNHPLASHDVSCLSCHSFKAEGSPQFGHGGNANCFSCHPEQSGPFLFEHDATSSFSTDGSGCVSCHTPHGSSNDRLLTQTDDKLCRQCHGQPLGHLTAHSGEFAGLNCMDCHSEIHGSYDNLFLLDPQLGDKLRGEPEGCFCHEFR